MSSVETEAKLEGSPVSKKYWRSLDDLADKPEFRAFVEREFPAYADEMMKPASRRSFLKFMGASMALAGMTSCRWPREEIAPFTQRPDGYVPGTPLQFATAMDMGGSATGLLVSSYDGRPIKVEGNPDHPQSLGATGSWHQAAVLGLYDPERSGNPTRNADGAEQAVDWNAFEAAVAEKIAPLRGRSGGARVRVLASADSSPSLARMRERFVAEFGAQWHEYEAISRDEERAGLALLFGDATPHRAHLHLDRARVVVSLDDDFIMAHPSSPRYARDWAASRRPDRDHYSRLYVLESAHSNTGSVADQRVPIRSSRIPTAIGCLAAWLFTDGHVALPAGAEGLRGTLERFKSDPLYSELDFSIAGGDLVKHGSHGLITVGAHQPAAVHALAQLINHALGAVGTTVSYTEDPTGPRASHVASIAELTRDMQAGEVDVLVLLGGNPVYDAPADLGFADALAKVGLTIHHSLYRDETSKACDWHVPRAHFMEAWGDARGHDGTRSIVQPLIEPLFNGKSAIELLALLMGRGPYNGYEIVRATMATDTGAAGFESRWRTALHDGLVRGSALPAVTPSLVGGAASSIGAALVTAAAAASDNEIRFLTHGALYDGRFANNGWLIELPDPMTKLCWDNAALMAPATAEALGVEDGNMVAVTVDGTSVELPAFVVPGQARGTIAVQVGYGRTAAGQVGNGSGFDVYPLRKSGGMGFAAASFVKGDGSYPLEGVQDHFIIDQLGRDERTERSHDLIRDADYEAYRHDPEHALHFHAHPTAKLWDEPINYDANKWGMAIDLNTCTGCSACVIACQAENNIPVVGKKEIGMGREMHWLRVDRYYAGDRDNPTIAHQPMPCQHCEDAPCEQVCPVAATVHDSEGLNVMVYNRCVGTRYCSNNCPFKVRRFNYFNNHKDEDPIRQMVYNPEVTVRSRGVMEKCSFCLQRIASAKIVARNEQRPVADGEVVPACAQVCPTQAISFGNLNDPNSRVRAEQEHVRAYKLLDVLNVKPRVSYLAKITNRAGGGSHGTEDHG